MSSPEFRLPHPRPQSLSDPFHDHTQEYLQSLLATPDDDLTWHDYQMLLGPFLPAGTYEESAYFLPLAFDHLLSCEDNSLDLVGSLVWFTSEYSYQLDRDGVLDVARSKLRQCLDHWTSHFTVIHFDADACRKKGWGLKYLDLVRNSNTVMEATNDLVRFKKHNDLALGFFADLAAAEVAPVRSAWFLESVRSHVCKDVYQPPRHPAISSLLDSETLARQHWRTVRESLPSYRKSSTYWLDTFTILGIAEEL